MLEEVVGTAQERQQILQDVSIAITAVTSEELEIIENCGPTVQCVHFLAKNARLKVRHPILKS